MKSKIIAALLLIAAVACGKNGSDPAETPQEDQISFEDHTGKTVKVLPDRKALVYWGWDNRWHEITDQANREKWNYVRENLTGFYTNFIDMWCMVYQNQKSAQETCKALYETFEGKSAFFEATMETAVNDSQYGYNNEETDRRTIDLLTNAGFSVDYTSVNYMTVANASYCKERMNLVATYRGSRKCFYLCGPWCFGGNIANDADAMEMSTWGDGAQTDGPLGFWYSNQNHMKETSYSIVKRMDKLGKETAIMLAPYYAGIDAYNPKTDFLKVSKDCVLGHEDAGAMPGLWTLWMYGAGGMELFPECTGTGASAAPVCSGTGVAWWLLKHLNELPVFNCGGKATESVSVTVKAGEVKQISMAFSNAGCPGVELAPVIRAVMDTKAKGWHYKFVRHANKVDITNDMVFNGGIECKGLMRITQASPFTVDLYIKADEDASPLTIEIEAMGNVSNTVNRKIIGTISLSRE